MVFVMVDLLVVAMVDKMVVLMVVKMVAKLGSLVLMSVDQKDP